MNATIAEAFLSTVDETAVSQLVDGGIENNNSKNILRSTNNDDDTKEKIKKYSEILCYARQIAEINKKEITRLKT